MAKQDDNDKKIKDMLSKVGAQKELLKKPKAGWETNANFPMAGKTVNLNTVHDPKVLVECLAFLFSKTENYEKASSVLGLEPEEFVWEGFGASLWLADFQKRVAYLKWQEQDKRLKAAEKKLKGLVSEETRTELELLELEKELLG